MPLMIAAALGFVPWFLVQFNQSVNVDIAWLTIAAGRMLDGQRMSEAYYETNPPLSVLVQIVPALLIKLFGAPLPQTVFLYSLALVLLSTLAIRAFLKRLTFMAEGDIDLLALAWLFANTVLAGQYIGERDHEVALALGPFILAQMALTRGMKLPPALMMPVLTAGAIFVLVKPHYGLIPALILAHRMVVQRRLSGVFDRDFVTLFIAVLLYALLIATAFADYLHVILPDSITFYVAAWENTALNQTLMLALFNGAMAVFAWLVLGSRARTLCALFLISTLCLIPFAVQGKDFFYQAIPAMAFMICGLALLANEALKACADRLMPCVHPFVPVIAFAMLAVFGYIALPPNAAYPSHDDYRQSSFAKVIQSCGHPCTFFMFNDMPEVIQQLQVYTREEHGSRFPCYWFLPGLLRAEDDLNHGRPSRLTRAEVEDLKRKYAGMVTADFRRYDPELLLIGQFDIVPGQGTFAFERYFTSGDPGFAVEWRRYRFVGTTELDPAFYFRGTLAAGFKKTTFRVYKKDHAALK